MTTSPRRRRETPRRRTRILAAAGAAAALVTAVLLVVLPGADDDGKPARSDSSTSTGSSGSGAAGADGAGSTGSSGTPGGPTGTSTDDDAILTPTDLERFALRGADLPPGWRTLDTVGPATQKLIGTCLRTATTPTVPHVSSTASYRSGSEGPVLSATVRDFTTPAQAKRAMTAVRTGITGCLGGSRPAARALAVTSQADASAGASFTLTQDGNAARGELMVARVGARSVTLVMIGLVEADLDTGRDALRTVVNRLR